MFCEMPRRISQSKQTAKPWETRKHVTFQNALQMEYKELKQAR